MIALAQLLNDLDLRPRGPIPDARIGAVTDDSRKCGPHTLFVAIPGTRVDGHNFLDQVAGSRAAAALVCRPVDKPPARLPLVQIDQPRRALALIAQRLAGDPSHELTVLAVTGTNGKTTITYLLESIFRAAGLKPGVIGTIDYRWEGHRESAPQTTPSPTQLAELLARMKADGVGAVAMEASSHAIDQHRVDGIRLASAGLTNITQDHLDYHRDMGAYRRAKQRLFTEVLPRNAEGCAVLNLDDPAGRDFAAALKGPRLNYSFHHAEAELRVESVTFSARGFSIVAKLRGESEIELTSPLHGVFNVQNCLTAAAMALGAGLPLAAVCEGIARLDAVPGRFEFIRQGRPFPVIVDYAHTPDSLLQVLLQARGFVRKRLIVVFGCGGDRDSAKRPLMGQAAGRLADVIVITNDNPRSEAPGPIAEAIAAGVRSVAPAWVEWSIELDRRAAIHRAVALAEDGDVVLIPGKGHEDYQIIGTERVHFDDREVAREAIAATATADGAAT